MANKKIAFIENHIGATAKIRFKLVDELQSRGYQIVVFTSFSEHDAKPPIPNVEFVNVGMSSGNPLTIILYSLKIFTALLKHRPCICLTFSIRPNIYANIVAFLFRIPTIMSITGIGPLFESSEITYRLARFLYPIALRKPKKVFFQNDDDLQLFLEKKWIKPSQKVKVPGSGVDTTHFKPLAKSNEFDFMFISRILKDKGILEFIDAVRILKKETKFSVAVVGNIWLNKSKALSISNEQIKTWVDEGLITYFNEVNDVRETLPTTRCIVLPSYREGTSNLLLESAAMEMPIITTNVAGCKEIVDDTVSGFICEPRSASDLAAKMNLFLQLNPTQQKEMGQKARIKMINEFEKKIVVTEYLSNIEQILAK